MKTYIDFSIGFAVYGLCCGIYYREFTKFNGFTERTMLVRGTMEVTGNPISSGVSGAVAGIAGLGHIAVAVGMIMALRIIKKNA